MSMIRLTQIDPPAKSPPSTGLIRAGDLRLGDDQTWQPVLLQSLSARIRMTGALATVELRSFFVTQSGRPPRQGYYAFPLPPGAVFAGFNLEGAGRSMNTRIMSPSEVQMSDLPSLPAPPMEFFDPSLVVIPVGILPEGAEVVARFTYSQIISALGSMLELRVPLLRTLMGPNDPLANLARMLSTGDGEEKKIIPAGPSLELIIEAENLTLEPAGCRCSHPVNLEEEDTDSWHMTMASSGDVPDRELVLQLQLKGDDAIPHLSMIENPEGEGVAWNFALNIIPPPPMVGARNARDLVVVLDSSLDVSNPGALSTRVVSDLLRSLGPDDRFNLLIAGDRIARFHVDPLVPASEGNIAGATTVLKKIPRNSQPPMLDAIRRAVRILSENTTRGRGQSIAVLSQYPSEESSEQIGSIGPALVEIQFMAVKFGPTEVGTLLTHLARMSRGRVLRIQSTQDLTPAIDRLLAGLDPPVVSQIEYNDHGLGIDGATLVPSRLKDLYAQIPVVQLGQCSNPTGSLVLRGIRAGGDAFAAPVKGRHSSCPAIAHLWARARLDRMVRAATALGSVKQSGPDDMTLALSKGFGVACPLTSWISVDEEMIQSPGGLESRLRSIGIAQVPGAAAPPDRSPKPLESGQKQPGQGGPSQAPDLQTVAEQMIESSTEVDDLLETLPGASIAPVEATTAKRKVLPQEIRACLKAIEEALAETSETGWMKFRWSRWTPDTLVEQLYQLRDRLRRHQKLLDRLHHYGVPEYEKWGIQMAFKDMENLLLGLQQSKDPPVDGVITFLKELKRAIRIRYGLEKAKKVRQKFDDIL